MTRPAGISKVTVGLVLVALALLYLQGAILHRAVWEHPWLALLSLAVGIAFMHPAAARFRSSLLTAVYDSPRRRFRSTLFLLAAAVHVLIVWESYEGVPRLDDGMAALFQARIFARGAVTLPLPPNAGFYEVFGVIGDDAGLGHWCGMYPPGWPALLTPGVWLGVPWLVNPLLGAWLVLVVYGLGKEFVGERVGRTAAILTLLSPLALALAGTHLSHTPTALFCGICFLQAYRLTRTGRARHGVGAGLAWGAAFLCRPLTALVVGMVIALGLLIDWRAVLRAWRGIVIAVGLAAAAVLVLMLFQYAITGDPFTAGHEIGMGKRGKFGYGELDRIRTHTLELGIDYTIKRLRAMNNDLIGFALPAFVFALIPFFRRRATREHLFLILPFPALLLTFKFYWYYEFYFEARYAFASVPMLLVPVAHGLHELVGGAQARSRRLGAAAAALVSVCVFYAAIVAIPQYFERFDDRFGDVEGILPRVVEAYNFTNTVVFMDAIGKAPEEEDPLNNYYATGFMRNDLDLQGPVIFAKNSRDENVHMLEVYPDRDYYLYRYLRHVNKAMLWRMVPEDGRFRYEPVAPLTRDVVPSVPL